MKTIFFQKDLLSNFKGDEQYLIESFTFSGGEEHINLHGIVAEGDEVTVEARINSSSDLFKIFLIKDALDRMKVKQATLLISYIPYARQDRVMVSGEPLSIKVFADHLNLCNFSKVKVLDPHSDVSSALINNIEMTSNKLFIMKSMNMIDIEWASNENICIVSPDAGAEKKIYNTCKDIGFTGDVLNCSKHRNVRTREVTDTRVYGDPKGKTCVIIDDILDGGRTFAALAAKLKELGAEKVFLIVTHGIFSHGEEQLKDLDHIYSTDSWRSYKSELITFIPI